MSNSGVHVCILPLQILIIPYLKQGRVIFKGCVLSAFWFTFTMPWLVTRVKPKELANCFVSMYLFPCITCVSMAFENKIYQIFMTHELQHLLIIFWQIFLPTKK